LHVPLQLAPAATLHEPVHCPVHVPPENFPVHCAVHDPLAFALQEPEHVPWQTPLEFVLPLHVPLQVPPHVPLKPAVQPTSHEPVHVGALQLPEHWPEHDTAADAVHSPEHVPLHAKLGAVTLHWALHEPLHTAPIVPVHVAGVTWQFACASHCAWTLALAWQFGTTVTEMLTFAARSALMYVWSTLHAACAVVCVVSRLSAPLISLQVFNHVVWRFVAAVFRSLSAVTHARMSAWAPDAEALRPLQPSAAACALAAALHPFVNAARAGSANAATVAYLKLVRFVIGRTPCGIEATPRRHLDVGSTSEPETRCNPTAAYGPRSMRNAPES
jgi:hypothetical protein